IALAVGGAGLRPLPPGEAGQERQLAGGERPAGRGRVDGRLLRPARGLQVEGGAVTRATSAGASGGRQPPDQGADAPRSPRQEPERGAPGTRQILPRGWVPAGSSCTSVPSWRTT